MFVVHKEPISEPGGCLSCVRAPAGQSTQLLHVFGPYCMCAWLHSLSDPALINWIWNSLSAMVLPLQATQQSVCLLVEGT